MASENDQEKTCEVNEQEETQQTTQESAQAEEPSTESAKREAGASHEEEAVPPPDVYSMLQFMLGMLAEQAWQFMGIRLTPGQKELSKDMTQAKIAIDTVAFIADKLHSQLGEEDRKAMRALVSDLQMNYVMHNK